MPLVLESIVSIGIITACWMMFGGLFGLMVSAESHDGTIMKDVQFISAYSVMGGFWLMVGSTALMLPFAIYSSYV